MTTQLDTLLIRPHPCPKDGVHHKCVLFYSYSDKIKQDFFIDRIEDNTEQVNSRQKLAQLIELCESQTCRRKYLLEYFGERWQEENCGGCDVCLTPREEFDATEIAQKILSAVIRTGQQFGESHISGVLRGTSTRRVRQLGHDRLSVYGIARDFKRDELKEVIQLLVAGGLLGRNGDRYPTLAVTPDGRRLLNTRSKLTLARPKPSPDKVPASKTEPIPYHHALFEELRNLRKTIADRRGVPPYVIFHDTALQQMASHLPQSRDSFSRISGIGARKLEEFSDEFLAVIRSYVQENGLTERKVALRSRNRKGSAGDAGTTYHKTKQLLLQKLTIDQIAEQRGVSEGTIVSHIGQLISAGEQLDLAYLMPQPDRLAKIEAAFQVAGSLQFLTPVRELLGGEYSYEELRLVRIALQQLQE